MASWRDEQKIMRPTIVKYLKKRIRLVLKKQGFTVKNNGHFSLSDDNREERRHVHQQAKYDRLNKRADSILSMSKLIEGHIPNGKDIELDKIKPKLIEIKANSKEELIYRWWNLVWWSLPYERAYGRQMRYLVWDDHHQATIGLIGLHSPILSWSVRDNYLGIKYKDRDYWVNQSLNAQRLGAVPPYNEILGGKLVALLMTSDIIRDKFRRKYSGVETVIRERNLPARLLFLTTTGAYGKSSVYERIKYDGEAVSKFIGYTQGSGSFHIPEDLYEDIIDYLDSRGYDVSRGYGSGPSRKLRIIDQGLQLLDFGNGASHGIKRAVYLFSLTKNLKEVIQNKKRPQWFHRNVDDLTDYWLNKWTMQRQNRIIEFNKFSGDKFMAKTKSDITHLIDHQIKH